MFKMKLAAVANFIAITHGEGLKFEPKAKGGARKITIDVMCSDTVDIFRHDEAGDHYVATGTGLFQIEMTITEATEFTFDWPDKGYLNVKLHGADQRVEKTTREKFTTIERRPSRDPVLDRMNMLMKHNFEQLEIKQEQEMAAIRRKLEKADDKASNSKDTGDGKAGRKATGAADKDGADAAAAKAADEGKGKPDVGKSDDKGDAKPPVPEVG